MPRLDRPVPQRKRSTSALDDTPLPEGPTRSSSDLHERRRQPRCTTVPILHLCAPRGKGNDAGPNGNGADAPTATPSSNCSSNCNWPTASPSSLRGPCRLTATPSSNWPTASPSSLRGPCRPTATPESSRPMLVVRHAPQADRRFRAVSHYGGPRRADNVPHQPTTQRVHRQRANVLAANGLGFT